jgi:hypothetical protein
VAQPRRARPDGIHFLERRYLDPTQAASVGEAVVQRCDPRDVAKLRLYHQDRFLSRAIGPEFAGETVPLREAIPGLGWRERSSHSAACSQTAARSRAPSRAILPTSGGVAGCATTR